MEIEKDGSTISVNINSCMKQDFLSVIVTDKKIEIETMTSCKIIPIKENSLLLITLPKDSYYQRIKLLFDGKYRVHTKITNVNTEIFQFHTYRHHQIITLEEFKIKDLKSSVTKQPYDILLADGKVTNMCLLGCMTNNQEVIVEDCAINDFRTNAEFLEISDTHLKNLHSANQHAIVFIGNHSTIETSNVPHFNVLHYMDNNHKFILNRLLGSEKMTNYFFNSSI